MRLQQSGFSDFGYSPSGSTAASGSDSGGTGQSTAFKALLGSVWSALGLSGSAGGIQAIASALSSALSAGLASGQDLAPQLTQTVDNALDRVAQQLEAKGVSPHHVAKLVARFRQDLADAVNNAAAAAGGSGSSAGAGTSQGASATPSATGTNTTSVGNSLASSLSELATVRESETLTIQTTDGAQVTISFRAQAAEFGASQTQSDGSSSSAAALFASDKFQVEVRGSLSSADLTAINNVVSQVDSLATQFFSGDVQDAFAAAASIGADPSEIAGFSLQMSYSTALYQQVGATGDPGTTNTVPPVVTSPTTTDQAGTAAANAASATGSAQTATTNPASAPSTDATAGTTANAATPAATTPSTSASAAPAATATPQQTIANFLQNALAKLSGSGGTLSARWGIQLLAVALPAYSQTQTATGSGAAGSAQQASPQSASPQWASPTSGPANSSPAVTQVAIAAPTQAAHLAAATLIQLVT
jgi:trimeric autotransporter adhesin